MISQEQIDAAVGILVREAQPEKVILFGSYARGDATPDSDLDLLVVQKEVPHQQAEMARLRRALSPLRIPVDLLVTDTARLSSSWADFPGSYLYDALREGKVLYAVDRASWSPFAVACRYEDWLAADPVDRVRALELVRAAITWTEGELPL